MPWPWALLERDMVLWGQNSKMQRRKNKTENGIGSCKSATFLCPYFFLAALIIFLKAGKHFPPRHTQAMIGTAGPPEILFRTIPRKFQETSTATSEVFHWCKAEYGSQAVKSEVQHKPYVGIWNLERTLTNECMSDRNMRFWFDETHSGGSFSVGRSACIGNAHAQCSPCISIHDSTYPLATL